MKNKMRKFKNIHPNPNSNIYIIASGKSFLIIK